MESLASSRTLQMEKSVSNRSEGNIARLADTILFQVAGEAQGDDEALKKLKADLNEGPRAAHVVKLEVKDIAVKDGEKSFDVA